MDTHKELDFHLMTWVHIYFGGLFPSSFPEVTELKSGLILPLFKMRVMYIFSMESEEGTSKSPSLPKLEALGENSVYF